MTPLIRLGIAWMGGIALARWFNVPWEIVALLTLVAVSALWLYRKNTKPKLWAILALVLTAGALRFIMAQPTINPQHIAFYNNTPRPLKITGTVVNEPDLRDTYINLRLRAESIELDGVSQPVDGLVLVRAPRYPEYFYGDHLTVIGKPETPPEFEDFSYKDFLARFGIHTIMRRVKIEPLGDNKGHPFWLNLYAFKRYASQTINQILPEPHASLLNGILLGIDVGIPGDLYEKFNLTGTSHIIVISGSNIAIVAGILLFLGQKTVGKKLTPPLAIAGIVIYTLLVGADSAVNRAAVMGIVWIMAMAVGRPGYALNSLLLSGFVLTLINPFILWDVGFQLSFMATLGLIVLVPPLERGTFRLLKRSFNTNHIGLPMALLSELVIITLAAQIITSPLVVYHFGRLSLVSLLSNLFILAVQPAIMIFGALATLAGMLWLPLGQLIGWAVWLPLAWTIAVIEETSSWPYAALDVDAFPFWLMVLAYAAMAAGIWWANHDKEQVPRFKLKPVGNIYTRLWLGGMAIITLLIWLAIGSLPDGRLHVVFLDVGQGDAILVTLPNGRQLLIDGGPSATQLNWQLGKSMPFWDHSLDMVVNTHPDADHLAGLVPLLERYQVDQTLVSDTQNDGELFTAWQEKLSAAGLAPIIAQADTQLSLGQGITATILSPGPTLNAGDPNNRSVVLKLEMGQVSFLLPGDIEEPVEQNLVYADTPLTATVLKSPHHGSKTSSSELFLDAVNPQIAIISVGQDNHFGHPSSDILERYTAHGITTLRTDEHGKIEFITDGQKLWVETSR